MIRSMLGALVLASVATTLASCDGGCGSGEPAGPAPAGETWADRWTLGFVGPDERPASDEAWFVRLVRVSAGGNFDSWGSEELRFSIASRGTRIEVGSRSIDLPARGLVDVPVAGGPWIELHPDELAFVVRVDDVDVTESERVLAVECRLAASDFPAAATERTFPAGTIRTGGVSIEGASVTLALVRAPRRREPDARDLETARRLFAEPLGTERPATPAGARAAAARLARASGDALADAAGSLDTARRNLLVGLARAAAGPASAAAAYGEADPALVREAQARLREALGRDGRDAPAELQELARGLFERPVPDAPDARDLDLFLAEVRALRNRREVDRMFWSKAALETLDERVSKARAGLDQRSRCEEAWRRYEAEVRSALGS